MGGLLVLVSAVGLVGLAAHGLATDQVYTEALVAPPGPAVLSPVLDPGSPIAQTVAALSAPGLLRMGPGGTAILGLAASWKEEDGGSRYAFTLPRSGRWSDGEPITTRDVGFTLAVLQTPHFPNPSLAAPWTGISLYATSFWAGTFVLPAPAPNFSITAELPILPAGQYHDQPLRFVRQAASASAAPIPSAGPFAVSADTRTEVSLTRNPYYRPAAQLAGFTIQLEPSPAQVVDQLAKGRVDGWLAPVDADLQGLPRGLVEQRMTSYSLVELLMNEASAPLSILPVRQAIASAIDRRQLIAQGLGGLGRPQYGPLPDSIPWARLSAAALGTLPNATQLLSEAGYQRSGPGGAFTHQGQPLSLVLSVPSTEPLPQAAQALGKMLTAAGIAVTVQVRPGQSFVADVLEPERFQLALVGFDNGPDPNLTSFWSSSSAPGQSLNFSQAPADPVLNHELDQLATANSVSARSAAYREVATRLFQDMPAVFLYTPTVVYVHLASVHVPGIPADGDPYQRFQDVTGWSL